MTLPKTILWCDIETTGLDPATDKVLEVCFIAADFSNPFHIEDGVRGVEKVFPFKDWSKVPQEVIQMHAAFSGGNNPLMLDCMLAQPTDSKFTDYEEMDQLLCRTFFPKGRTENQPVLAGSTVHFDLNFVRTHFPQFATGLSHRCYDVSAVKLFCYSLGMPEIPKTTPQHRARGDILSSIDHAKQCAAWLEKMKPKDYDYDRGG